MSGASKLTLRAVLVFGAEVRLGRGAWSSFYKTSRSAERRRTGHPSRRFFILARRWMGAVSGASKLPFAAICDLGKQSDRMPQFTSAVVGLCRFSWLGLVVAQAFEDCADYQGEGYCGVVEDFGEAAAFFEGDEFSPGDGFGVGAA